MPYHSKPVSLEAVGNTGCGVVYRYWQSLCGDAFAPRWADVDLMALPADVVPHVRVVDVIDGGRDFRYRFWGTGLTDVCKGERSGQSVFSKMSARREVAISEYRRVCETKAPYFYVYNANWRDDLADLYAPALRLPISGNGGEVDKILSYVDFRTDRVVWKTFFETHPA